MTISRSLAASLVASLLAALAAVSPAAGQDGMRPGPPPVADAGATPDTGGSRLDLAAMTLAAEDLPEGYLLSSETYVRGDQLAGLFNSPNLTPEEVAESGLRWFYDSQYLNSQTAGRIRSYAEEYADPEGAEIGFNLLEDETRFISSTDESVDEPGPDFAEEPSETTIGTYALADGSSYSAVDITFRVGRVIAGVSVESSDPGLPPDRDLADDLAERLFERIETVLNGGELDGLDQSLAAVALPIGGLGLNIQEGYVSLADVQATLPDPAIYADYASGYVVSVALGDGAGGNFGPFVTANVARFGAESAALEVLAEGDILAPAFQGVERVPASELDIDGADAVVGFQFTNAFSADGEIDSIRLLIVKGDILVTVEVQAAASSDDAREGAVALAEQQLACLDAGTCETVTIPPAISGNGNTVA